ncbi:hypothetical protein RM533_03925 [Croceicoccus sp. F390]|uniref:Glycosyltransferase n=1 Tax=Croceicoccus esteveae TaxID=3075597 RepID=A0ABU2ZGX6_9SPHN|nr:hypothetical protein [Croceicoccus sp. F390]MDT0575328.1 hypothetical protein [Croceicoccus sp. F390]
MAKPIIVHKLRRVLHLGLEDDLAPWKMRLIRSLPSGMQNHGPDADDALASRLQLYRPSFPSLDGVAGLGRMARMARTMRGYDLVVTWGERAINAVMAHSLFTQPLSLPPLVNMHDSLEGFSGGRLRDLRHRIAFSRTPIIVVPTLTSAQEFARAWSPAAGSIHAVTPLYPPAPRDSVRPDAIPRLLKRRQEKWIGTRAADIAPFADSLMQALRKLDSAWLMVVFGSSAQAAPVAEAAQQAGVQDRLLFSDRMDGPGARIGQTSLAGMFELAIVRAHGCIPSDLLEAQAAKVPCIAIGGPALAQLLPPDTRMVQHVSPDAGAIAEAMVMLCADEEARRATGKSNGQFAAAHTSPAEYHQLLAGLLGVPKLT